MVYGKSETLCLAKWLLYSDPKVAPLGDHEVAPLTRSRFGSIRVIINICWSVWSAGWRASISPGQSFIFQPILNF
jgi:hypothetical protein